jgi:hypothetical protein
MQPLVSATKPALANVRKFRVTTSLAVPRYLAMALVTTEPGPGCRQPGLSGGRFLL